MAAQEVVDTDPHSVLRNDGITNADLDGSYNQVITRLEETKKRMGAPPWSVRVVYNEIISGVLICQNPGEGNRWGKALPRLRFGPPTVRSARRDRPRPQVDMRQDAR